MPPSQTASNGSPRLKSPLVSKYFHEPGRAGSVAVDGGPDSSTESLLLPNGQRALHGSGFDSRVQDFSSSATPGSMNFPVPPPRPPAAALPLISAYNLPQAGYTTNVAGVQQQRNASVPIDSAKRGIKYKHSHSRSQDQIGKPVPPPRSQEFIHQEEEQSSVPTTPKSRPSRKVSVDGYTLQPIAYSPVPPSIDEDQQSQASWETGDDETSKTPPPKPPKIRDEQLQMPQIPPRLPLLYFEQDQQVDQMDFAYQRPSHSSRGASQTDITSPRDDDITPNSNENPHQKTFDRPTPPSIDTSQQYPKPLHGEGIGEGRPPAQDKNRESDDANSSFYWHSPSSNSASPKPFDEESTPPGPPRRNTDSLTSATALGFGGPSDWEHFGDYEAEEVDDIDLYTSHKPKTAELPDETAPGGTLPDVETTILDGAALGAHSRPIGERVLSTIEERNSEHLDQIPPQAVDDCHGHDINVKSMTNAHPPPEPREPLSTPPRHLSSEEPETPVIINAVQHKIGSEPPRLPESSFGISSFQVNISPPQGETTSPTAGGSQAGRSESDNRPAESPPTVAIDPTPASAPASAPTAITPDIGVVLKNKQSVERIVIPAQVPTDAPRNGTPSWVARQVTRDSRDSLDKASQLTSPASDDDGKEDIIISLQVPETPPPADKPAPLNLADVRNRRASASLNSAGMSTEPSQKSPDFLRSGRRSIFPQSIEIEDPYAGLDPWAKASLNRYVKMLRDESQAGTDEEKYMTFVNFTYKETQIRGVLYDMDDESDLSDNPVNRLHSKKGAKKAQALFQSQSQPQLKPAVQSQQQAQPQFQVQGPQSQSPQHLPESQQQPPIQVQQPTQGRQKNLNAKALPALPPKNTPMCPPQIQHTPPSDDSMSNQNVSAPGTFSTHNGRAGPSGNSDESFGIVDQPRSEQESPPENNPRDLKVKASGVLRGTPSLGALRKAIDVIAPKKPFTSPASHDPPTDTKQAPVTPEAESSTPPIAQLTTDIVDGDSSHSSDKPEYKVFSYNNEGKPYIGDKAANRQTIYRPFSTMLRQTSVRSGGADTIRSFGHGNTSSISSESHFMRGASGGSNSDSRTVNYRYTILEPLIRVIPQQEILRQEPEAFVRLRHSMDAIPDDFSFIHKTMLAWDKESKKAREPHERERHARQAASEQRIDELFNANEIGYSDISRLEADFKRAEAAKKAEEDREDVQTFVSSVFDVVWARVNYEMDQLTPLYEECTRLAADASAGRGMFDDDPDRVPIAPAMEALLILYHKLNLRHQKAFEAVLERDRRLKETEVNPWYAVGAIDKVKLIKDRFENAEKKAILEFCRQRDERANLLMDVLDQNTLRGVGANQDYMESVMQAVRKIAFDVALGAVGDDDVVASEDVIRAKTITTALAKSSEQIVQTFHVADMLLNAADYEVSVANAKLSNADANAFRRLRDAKAKEDNKLALDLEHRMALIRGDTARTQDEIAKLLMLIQRSDDGDEDSADDSQRLAHSEKEERLRRALEEAKLRDSHQAGGTLV